MLRGFKNILSSLQGEYIEFLKSHGLAKNLLSYIIKISGNTSIDEVACLQTLSWQEIDFSKFIIDYSVKQDLTIAPKAYVCEKTGTDLIAAIPWEGTKEVDIIFHHSKILRSWCSKMDGKCKYSWDEYSDHLIEE